jgi:photosystem II stability/assembly factor-like uncharacterized protein
MVGDEREILMVRDLDQDQQQDIVYALATSPNFAKDGVCFAARQLGLHRSDDGGHTWRSLFAGLGPETLLPANCVALSPSFESDGVMFTGVPGQILRSIDGGKNWSAALLPPPPPFISALVVSPSYVDDGIVFAGTMEDGMFRSGDRGAHWEAWNFGLLDLNILCLSVSPNLASDETLFVGTDSGVFRSTNGGRAWRETGFPAEAAPVLSLAISPMFAHDGTLFAGTESYGLFCSEDRGKSWQRVAEQNIPGIVNMILLSPSFPQKPEILALTDDALLFSRDGGKSWAGREAGIDLDTGATCVVAPSGFGQRSRLMVGLADGRVLHI